MKENSLRHTPITADHSIPYNTVNCYWYTSRYTAVYYVIILFKHIITKCVDGGTGKFTGDRETRMLAADTQQEFSHLQ